MSAPSTSPDGPGSIPCADQSEATPPAPSARVAGGLPSSGDPGFICPRCGRAGAMRNLGDGLTWCDDCNVGWTDEDWD